MSIYKRSTPHSNAIPRPNCTKCGVPTLLFGIEPAENPKKELWTFYCLKCQGYQTAIGDPD